MWGLYILLIIFGSIVGVCVVLMIAHEIICNRYRKYLEKEPCIYTDRKTAYMMEAEVEELKKDTSKEIIMVESYYPFYLTWSDDMAEEGKDKRRVIYIDKAEQEERTAEHNKWKDKHSKVMEWVYNQQKPLFITFASLVIFGFCFVCCILALIIAMINMPTAIFTYKEMHSMIEQAIANGTDLENIAITQTKIDFNTWLSEALVSLERWGNWSKWYPWKEQILQLSYLF